jgi:two-component system phosphate regulon response regulator PhoB
MLEATMKAKARKKSAPAGNGNGSTNVGRANLLAVEDEQDLLELLQYNLNREGFNVRTAASGEEALKMIRDDPPELVVLDLMLPGMDGLELCRILKNDPTTRHIQIVMLTAKGEEVDIVAGLELGADDYVVKPFSPRVLSARIKAVLRRQAAEASASDAAVYRVGNLTMDTARHEVRIDGQRVNLTHTEIGIIQALARRPGHVLTRSQIVQAVQGDHVAVTDRSVDVHIVSLRRKLGDAGAYLQTVRGVGYRLEES